MKVREHEGDEVRIEDPSVVYIEFTMPGVRVHVAVYAEGLIEVSEYHQDPKREVSYSIESMGTGERSLVFG